MTRHTVELREVVIGGRALELASAELELERDELLPGHRGFDSWRVRVRTQRPDARLRADRQDTAIVTEDGTRAGGDLHQLGLLTAEGERYSGEALLETIADDALEFSGSGPLFRR